MLTRFISTSTSITGSLNVWIPWWFSSVHLKRRRPLVTSRFIRWPCYLLAWSIVVIVGSTTRPLSRYILPLLPVWISLRGIWQTLKIRVRPISRRRHLPVYWRSFIRVLLALNLTPIISWWSQEMYLIKSFLVELRDLVPQIASFYLPLSHQDTKKPRSA